MLTTANGVIIGTAALLLTERQVCERLQLGRSTIRKLWSDGELVPLHVGRAVRWPASAVEEYVERLKAA